MWRRACTQQPVPAIQRYRAGAHSSALGFLPFAVGVWVAVQGLRTGRCGEIVGGIVVGIGTLVGIWAGRTSWAHARFRLEDEGMRVGFRRRFYAYRDVEEVTARSDEIRVRFRGRTRTMTVVSDVVNSVEIVGYIWSRSRDSRMPTNPS